MKRVVNALLSSIPSILNIVLVCVLFFMIFAILGVFQFKGRFYSCDMSSFSPELLDSLDMTYGFSTLSYKQMFSSENCTFYGGEWKNSGANFDNVLKGMMSLFEMSTTEGWVELMFQGIDATEIGYQPVENWSRIRAMFFLRTYYFFSTFKCQLNSHVSSVCNCRQLFRNESLCWSCD